MTGKSTKGTRRKYDASFKEDVLRMVAAGRSVSDIAQALGIGTHIIYRWIKTAKQANAPDNPFSTSDPSAEIERLKAALHRTEQERDILKKALGIFSRGN
jgi:transposase